jgi:hypothetical protein
MMPPPLIIASTSLFNQLKREGWELHPSRSDASNISPYLSVVTMIALSGIFVQYHGRCGIWDCLKRLMRQHFLCNALQELLNLLSNITQKYVPRPSAYEYDVVHWYPC